MPVFDDRPAFKPRRAVNINGIGQVIRVRSSKRIVLLITVQNDGRGQRGQAKEDKCCRDRTPHGPPDFHKSPYKVPHF